MNRTLKEQLIEKGIVQPIKQAKAKNNTRTSKKRDEILSERDLRELMGETMPTYGRARGGAFRQR